MREIEPGISAIRSQLGVVAEDPRIFKAYSEDEAIRAARTIAEDDLLDRRVRRLVAVGIPFDLRPAHLMPRVDRFAARIKRSPERVRSDLILWESLDPVTRFDLVHRAVRMILAWRAAATY